MKIVKLIFGVIFYFHIAECLSGEYVSELRKSGDIIFQISQSSQGILIQRATKSQYSHVGLVFICANKSIGDFKCVNNKAYVLEAVGPVKYTDLATWITHGKGKYVVKRYASTSDVDSKKLIAAAKPFVGKPYDVKFLWSDTEIYCSELVWKIYKNAFDIELSPKVALKSYAPIDEDIKSVLKKRLGKEINYDEIVVAPEGLFNSKQLVEIASVH